MKEFSDDKGRQWTVHLSCASLKWVAEHAQFDLADFSNTKVVELFSGNASNLLDVLWPLVKADAESRGVGYESFGEGLRGDALAAATAVLKEELLDFFPSDRRKLLSLLLRRMEEAVVEAAAVAEQQIANARVSTESGGTLLTSAPESLESAQTTGPCES